MSTVPAAAAPERQLEQASGAARAASERLGVRIRPLESVPDQTSAAELAMHVWRSPDTSALDPSMLRALAHTGNFVYGAFDGEDLVAMSVGFRTGTPPGGLHSHMTCTAEGRRGVGLGYALKLHQRSWALAEGLTSITWTFDPLVRRNAYFNLAKLGAMATEYLPDFYGSMSDGLNAGDESDRLLVTWDITTGGGRGPVDGFPATGDELLLWESPSGEPVRAAPSPDVRRVGCQVPSDIVAVRSEDPALALLWRHALRSSLLDAGSAGFQVTGFTRSGYYLLSRPADSGTAAEDW